VTVFAPRVREEAGRWMWWSLKRVELDWGVWLMVRLAILRPRKSSQRSDSWILDKSNITFTAPKK